MSKRTFRLVVIVLLLSMLLSTATFATMDASQYLTYYSAYITKTGSTIKVHFDVQGTRIMDYIGATEIYLYERANSSSSWSLVQTYLSTDPAFASSMIEVNTSFKDDYVSYSGNSSYQYMAYVTIYAEKNGGSDSRDIIAYY